MKISTLYVAVHDKNEETRGSRSMLTQLLSSFNCPGTVLYATYLRVA